MPLRGRFALRLWWLTARFPCWRARHAGVRFMHSTSKDGSAVAMRSRGRLQLGEGRAAARRRGARRGTMASAAICVSETGRRGRLLRSTNGAAERAIELASRDTLDRRNRRNRHNAPKGIESATA